jgi:outer membrane murein-binding lipoprotein Lpp
MKKQSIFTLILTAIMSLALFSAGCEDQKKIDEANKFVDSANKKADEVKGLVGKAASTV